ncbi:BOP1NT domain protein [Trichuris suis]|nr:BOP1NT domain protein [Trichuris suis]
MGRTMECVDGPVSSAVHSQMDGEPMEVEEDVDKLNKGEEVDPGQMEDTDSSDEEDLRNTIGNIPIHWYDSYDHIGYDLRGRKIPKPPAPDEIEEFLSKMEDPNYWKTVFDPQLGKNVVLPDEAVETIRNVHEGRFPIPGYNPYEDFVDFFSHEKAVMPVFDAPLTKRSFVPSRVERRKVSMLLQSLKIRKRLMAERQRKKEEVPMYYDLWAEERTEPLSKSEKARLKMRIPASKMKLPGHAESYNPPSEYLLTDKEIEKWQNQEPYERRLDFIPEKYSCMRHLPAYKQFVKERFDRCVDLYLAPRQRKQRLNVNPEDLLPKLPKPSELRPFPTKEVLKYKGHKAAVLSLDINPTGDYLLSGSKDRTIRLWDVASGRCLQVVEIGEEVQSVAWCPNAKLCMAAIGTGCRIIFVNLRVGSRTTMSRTDDYFENIWETNKDAAGKSNSAFWEKCEGSEYDKGFRFVIAHKKLIKQVTWHSRGDYLAAVSPQSGSNTVIVHHISKMRSQAPFAKNKGLVQRVLFHPLRPYFFVATERHVRVYNLAKQQLIKKLYTNMQRISDMALHPKGDNVVVGGYDARLNWFDLDLSTRPYRKLRYHKYCIRSVAFHARYPLFASCSDDGSARVFHGMVYNDFLQNPLIVPLKVLRGHDVVDQYGALDCIFHPYQPWLFTCGGDSTVRLFV